MIILAGLAGFGYLGLWGALNWRRWPAKPLAIILKLTWLESLICLGAACMFVFMPVHEGLTASLTRPLIALSLLVVGGVLVLLRVLALHLLRQGRHWAAGWLEDLRWLIVLGAVVYWLLIGLQPWIQLTHDMFTG
ncbi:hypothetical protein JW859_03615 [bacterium]|nr:hypothetical protein [bacterium]